MQGHARPRGGDVGAILAVYRKAAAFTMKGDAKGMMTLTTADFTSTDIKGKVSSYAESEKETAAFLKSVTHIHYTWKVSNLRIKSPAASNVVDYVLNGQAIDPKGKAHAVRIVGRENHTWRKEVGVWKQASSKALKEQVFLDGKLVK